MSLSHELRTAQLMHAGIAVWNNEENQKKYKLDKINVDWTRRF